MNTLVEFQGKVQEEELDSCRADRRAGDGSGKGMQGATSTGSPCPIFTQQKEGRRHAALLCICPLGRFLPSLGSRLRGLLGLLLGSELLLHLDDDGVGVYALH